MTTFDDEHGHHSSHSSHSGPAPAPVIRHGPPAPEEPHRWSAPHDPRYHGGFEVSHDVLRDVGAAMKGQDMYELDDALRQLRQSAQDLGSLSRWSTGSGLAGNIQSARDGFLDAGGQVGDAHLSAARKLMDTADAYDEAEQRIKRHAHGASGAHDSTHGHHGV